MTNKLSYTIVALTLIVLLLLFNTYQFLFAASTIIFVAILMLHFVILASWIFPNRIVIEPQRVGKALSLIWIFVMTFFPLVYFSLIYSAIIVGYMAAVNAVVAIIFNLKRTNFNE